MLPIPVALLSLQFVRLRSLRCALLVAGPPTREDRPKHRPKGGGFVW